MELVGALSKKLAITLVHLIVFLLLWEALALLVRALVIPDVWKLAQHLPHAVAVVFRRHLLLTLAWVGIAYASGTVGGLVLGWTMYSVRRRECPEFRWR